MSPINSLAGFSVQATSKIQINGQTYRIGDHGVTAIELAIEMLDRRMRFQSLLTLRSEIRSCELDNCKAALTYLIKRTPNYNLKIIALWLRGRCGGYVGSQTIAKFAESDDEKMRYLAAKAMQSMGVWSTLAVMAKSDPSERVRRIATTRPPRKFRERLSNFSSSLESLPCSTNQRGLFWSSLIDIGSPIGTKSVELIRHLLERIRSVQRS